MIPVGHTVLVLCWLAVSEGKETKTLRESQHTMKVWAEEKKIQGEKYLITALVPASPQFLILLSLLLL